MQFDRGYISPYMVTDPDKMEAVMSNPYVFITDRKITLINDIMPVLEKLVQQGRELLIIAEDVEGGSPGNPGCEPSAWYLQGCGCEGSWLR